MYKTFRRKTLKHYGQAKISVKQLESHDGS